jgi:hypothetical protein
MQRTLIKAIYIFCIYSRAMTLAIARQYVDILLRICSSECIHPVTKENYKRALTSEDADTEESAMSQEDDSWL